MDADDLTCEAESQADFAEAKNWYDRIKRAYKMVEARKLIFDETEEPPIDFDALDRFGRGRDAFIKHLQTIMFPDIEDGFRLEFALRAYEAYPDEAVWKEQNYNSMTMIILARPYAKLKAEYEILKAQFEKLKEQIQEQRIELLDLKSEW